MIFKILFHSICAIVILQQQDLVNGDVGGKATVPMISAAIPGTNYYSHGPLGRDNYARNLPGFGNGLYEQAIPNPYSPLLQQQQQYRAFPATGQPAPYNSYGQHHLERQSANLILPPSAATGYAASGLDSWRHYPYNRNA